MASKEVEEILRKYSRKIEQQAQGFDSGQNTSQNIAASREFIQFKQDMMPELSRYEKWVKSLGSFIKIKLGAKDNAKISKHLESAHLDVETGEVAGLAVMGFLGVFFIGILISIAVWFLGFDFPTLFLFLMFVTSFFLPFQTNSTSRFSSNSLNRYPSGKGLPFSKRVVISLISLSFSFIVLFH